MGTLQQRHLLFVVGMHRSGTSAVCAALEACGVAFGEALLAPMARVNERGFWEAESVVALNEELLRRAGTAWYRMSADTAAFDFSGTAYSDCRDTARELLEAGFGDGPVEAIKDPRLCLTLPFWLQACAEVGLGCSACSVHRHPLAIARSLEARDGLPPGYGLRLTAMYERLAVTALPPGSYQVQFEQLLETPAEVLGPILAALPLQVDEAALQQAVDASLRHHSGADAAASPLTWGNIGSAELEDQIEARYPLVDTLSALADGFVHRGRELTRMGELHSRALAIIGEREGQLAQTQDENNRIGGLHSEALAVIAEKDKQMAGLAAHYEAQLSEIGEMHSRALAVVDQRDEQIVEFDRIGAERDEQFRELERRLAEIGELHSKSLARVEELDRQLAYVRGFPVLGKVFGAFLKRARR